MTTRFSSSDYSEGYWERAEGSNYSNYADDPGWEVILRVMRKYTPEGSTLTEVACSKGWFVYHANRYGLAARGFDLSEYAVSHAAPGTSTSIYVHDAIDPWPVPPESQDIVCAWEFFEHIHDENIPAVLSNMIAALKPGGRLWLKTGIVIPSDHPFAGQADHDHTHVAVHDRAWWENLFSFAGLVQNKDIENELDQAFSGRDWTGRFFTWEKPL